MKRKHPNQKGGAAVEFALVLPILIALVLGIVEFSVALYDKAVITNASREGARAGIVFRDPPLTEGEISSIVASYCQNRLITFGTPTQVTTTVVREGSGATGDDLIVQVQYQYQFLAIPKFVTGITGGIQLDAQTIMRME
jgi:Flp pilus assembly protein TadG